MKKLLFYTAMLALSLSACTPDTATDAAAPDHGDIKLQLISYNEDFELYAEATPFVVDQASDILAHFTHLHDFSSLDSGSVSLSLIVGSKGVRQTIDSPLRNGIYSFSITPIATGPGELIFDIKTNKGASKVIVQNIIVYADNETAFHEADELIITDPNGIIFTKEQSWKIDFSTVEAKSSEFGQVIRTGALIQASQNDKVSVVARTGGIVTLSGDNIFEGTAVTAGAELFKISGAGLAGDNSHVRYVEAKNNYEESKANYERLKTLAEDKIVPESELLEAKSAYETSKFIYENLKQNFEGGAQIVKSPINGFVSQMYVRNGEYVEAGQPLFDVAQNKKLVLMADVQQKYAYELQNVITANVHSIQHQKTYTLTELNGKLSSYGRSVNHNNYLIPIRFEIDNNKGFVPGSFVELFIITQGEETSLTIPNTALLEEQGKYFVLIQLTPELFTKREVTTGATDGINTEIIEGLKEGERVVSIGAILVKLSQTAGALDPHAGHVH